MMLQRPAFGSRPAASEGQDKVESGAALKGVLGGGLVVDPSFAANIC